MKRDFDLIRDILLDIEENALFNKGYVPNIQGQDKDKVNYHIQLLKDAGLISGDCIPYKPRESFVIISITYKGHEFLDQIRPKSVWEKTKKTAMEKAGTLTFEIIKTLSAAIIKESIR